MGCPPSAFPPSRDCFSVPQRHLLRLLPLTESLGRRVVELSVHHLKLMVHFFLVIHLRVQGIHPAFYHPQSPSGNELLCLITYAGRKLHWLRELVFPPCDFLALVFSLQRGAVTKAPLSCSAARAPVSAPLWLVLWLETFLWLIPHKARLCCGNLLKLFHTHAKN